MDVLYQFPVRKNKKQKEAFRQAVCTYAQALGYETAVETGSLGARNVVIGDPKQAKYVITAHYDTCARLPFPNLITPCSFWLFMGWQLMITLVLLLPLFAVGTVIGLLANPLLSFYAVYLLLLAELALMLVGPANPKNANDNTSGVVTVLETAAALAQEMRSDVCFVLFDLEEAGLIGSSSYRSRHKKEIGRQLILNLDCVGEGDEILLFPTSRLKKNVAELEHLRAWCTCGEKSVALRDKGFAIYPSDQSNFPLGVGIAAFCRSKWAGLYLGKIHTTRDTILDENNVAVIRDYLISVVTAKERNTV